MSDRSAERALKTPIRSVPCPQGDDKPRIPIFSPKAGRMQSWIILTDESVGLDVHFHKGKSVLCTMQEGDCHLHTIGIGAKWYAYLHAIPSIGGRPVILAIPKQAWRYCPELKAHDGSLRGCLIETVRMGESNNSPLKVIWTYKTVKDIGKIPPINLLCTLLAAFGKLPPE